MVAPKHRLHTSVAHAVPDASPERTIARLMTIGQVGMEMAAPIGIGFGIDYGLGTMPIFMIVGAVLGFVGGVYHLIVLNRPRAS
jgi:F0F1-type ATP synthase assembly protein I